MIAEDRGNGRRNGSYSNEERGLRSRPGQDIGGKTACPNAGDAGGCHEVVRSAGLPFDRTGKQANFHERPNEGELVR